MNFPKWIGLLLIVASALVGCGKSNDAAPPAQSIPPAEPRAAQPKLQTMKLWLGAEELTAELALTAQQMQTGMMFRTNVAENEAMLFVFGAPQRASFWMKNCVIPLSCAYIDTDGVILETHDMKPHDETPIVANSENIRFVLETRQGWFERNHVSAGTVVRTEHGSLAETFFKR